VDCKLIALVQRVKECSVISRSQTKSSINLGLLALVGIESDDTIEDIKYITHKLIKLRIFNDSNAKMNLSVDDINGEIMVVSQFTLCGDTRKGNRPSYINAMDVNSAELVYNDLVDYMSENYNNIKTGIFQADMDIELINDGPVTLFIRSKN
jgi:D-tyrosyl-tRNA(Tyr) deacylase